MRNFDKILVLSSYNDGINRIFEDYCGGIRANCADYYYIDYIKLYLDKGKRGFEQHIEQLVAEKNIDAIFFIWWSCDLTFDLHFIERLSRKTVLVMNFFDTEYFFETVDRYYAQFADLVVLPDSNACHEYAYFSINTHASFSLFDSVHYRNKCIDTKDIDVSFVGNMKNADRAEYVAYLRENGINVYTRGTGSEQGFASFEEMVSIFNRSKINLNFTTLATVDNYIVPLPAIKQRIRQSKGRPIEIALCGGFVLSQYAVGIEEMFVPGEEFDIFRSKEEMLEKIRFYLTHDEKRIEMAKKSYQRAQKQYDAKAGFAIIFEKLRALPPREQFPLCVDNNFLRIYVSSRFFYIARHLLAGRVAHMVEEFGVILREPKISLPMAYFFAVKGCVFALLKKPALYAKLKRFKTALGIKVKY